MHPKHFPGLRADQTELLLSIAKTGYPEQVLALPYWETERRASGLAVLAFGAELKAIPAKVTDPVLGAVRFAFWREALEEIEQGRARAHPVAQGLLAVHSPLTIEGRAGLSAFVDCAERALLPAEGDAPFDLGEPDFSFLPLLASVSCATLTSEQRSMLAQLGKAARQPETPARIRQLVSGLRPLTTSLAPVVLASQLAAERRSGQIRSQLGRKWFLFRQILLGQ